MTGVTLYDYWRSSASYRVRIALNLAGVDYKTVPINLTKREQCSEHHLARNPLGFVPVLEIDGLVLTQSLAILEYLEETRLLGLLPGDAAGRARVRAISYAIAMDIHPVCNLSVVDQVMQLAGAGSDIGSRWMQKFIGERLSGVEKMLATHPNDPFCHGEDPTLADLCLIPQVYNARRWNVSLDALPNVVRIAAHCDNDPAFRAAQPREPKQPSNYVKG